CNIAKKRRRGEGNGNGVNKQSKSVTPSKSMNTSSYPINKSQRTRSTTKNHPLAVVAKRTFPTPKALPNTSEPPKDNTCEGEAAQLATRTPRIQRKWTEEDMAKSPYSTGGWPLPSKVLYAIWNKMSAPFDLNEFSQFEGDDTNWSQVSEVPNSQDPPVTSSEHIRSFPVNSAMPSQGIFGTPRCSLSRAFTHLGALSPNLMQAHPLRPPFVTPRSMHPMSEMPQTLPAPSLAHPNTYSTFEYYSPFPSSTSFLHAPLHVRPPSPSPPHPLSQSQVASSVVHSMESGDHGSNNGVDDATLDIGLDGSNGKGAIDEGMDDRLKVSSRKRSIGGKEKGKDNSRASQKQSKAKERRQKLAEGEASTYRDHWSIDDFRIIATHHHQWELPQVLVNFGSLGMSDANPPDPSSTGKRRGHADTRQASIRQDFQDANRMMMERMERQHKERSEQQQQQAQLEQQQMTEMLALQARQVQATESQFHLAQQSMDTLQGFLGAYLSRQPPP
ncbi:hypothetical protein L7F22_068350, partial [Adiantum nelumboides]|nr:hypothetical protein [Adiantum nelumboides]